MPRYFSSRSREQLTAVIEALPPGGQHLVPLMEMVRDGGVGMMFVSQTPEPFRIPKAKPAIVIIGDDYDKAVGPERFHMPSVRRAIRDCHVFTVVSSAATTPVYAMSGLAAVLNRKHSMLIETRPEQEIAWVNLIKKLSPGALICLSTVEGGHA